MNVKVTQSCLTLCDHGSLQARILERVAFPFSRGSSQPRGRTQVSCVAGSFLPAEPWGKPPLLLFGRSVRSDSLWPHALQHARLSCPSLSPRLFPNSCPLTWWCYLSVSSSAAPFFCLQPFPASGSFPMSCLWANNSAPGYIPKRKRKHSSTQRLVYRHSLFTVTKKGKQPNRPTAEECRRVWSVRQWNTAQQQKGSKCWDALQHEPTLKASWSVKAASHKMPHVALPHSCEMSRISRSRNVA